MLQQQYLDGKQTLSGGDNAARESRHCWPQGGLAAFASKGPGGGRVAPRNQRGPGPSARLQTQPHRAPPGSPLGICSLVSPRQGPLPPAGFCVSMLPRVTSRLLGSGRVQGSLWAGADSGVSMDHGSPRSAEVVPSLSHDAGPSSQKEFTGPESAWAPSPVRSCNTRQPSLSPVTSCRHRGPSLSLCGTARAQPRGHPWTPWAGAGARVPVSA